MSKLSTSCQKFEHKLMPNNLHTFFGGGGGPRESCAAPKYAATMRAKKGKNRGKSILTLIAREPKREGVTGLGLAKKMACNKSKRAA